VSKRHSLLDLTGCLDELNGVVVVLLDTSANGKNIGIEDNVLGEKSDLINENVVSTLANGNLAVLLDSLAFLIESHTDDSRAILANKSSLLDEVSLAFLKGNGVDNALTLSSLQALNDDVEVGRINHDGDLGNLRIGANEAQELAHGGLRVEHALIKVKIEHLSTGVNLIERDSSSLVVLVLLDEAGKATRASNVTTLTDVDKVKVLGENKRLQTRDDHASGSRGWLTRSNSGNGIRNGLNVGRAGTAATTDHVDQSSLGELLDQRSHILRCLIILSEGIRETSIRVAGDEARGSVGETLNEGTHLLSSKCTVKSDAKRVGMQDRGQKGLRVLTRESSASQVDDGSGDHNGRSVVFGAGRQDSLASKDGSLTVQGVEDSLDKENISTTIKQGLGLLLVKSDKLIEGWNNQSECESRRWWPQ
jgi:hypothetical protein